MHHIVKNATGFHDDSDCLKNRSEEDLSTLSQDAERILNDARPFNSLCLKDCSFDI